MRLTLSGPKSINMVLNSEKSGTVLTGYVGPCAGETQKQRKIVVPQRSGF